MTHIESEHGQPQRTEGAEHGLSIVDITIDNVSRRIHRGRQTVVELKKFGEVPLAYDLDQIIAGKFQPLPDDSSVTIKGGETFVSHPKDGSSS